MSLSVAQDRAFMAHLTLGIGLASMLLAVTVRRLRAKHRDRHAVSYRAKAMAPNLDLPFILEHFARLNDPDYVCVSIAENKLTVGLLLERIADFGETARRIQEEGILGNEDGEKEYTKSFREENLDVNSKPAEKAAGKLLGGSTLPTKEGADGNGQTAAVVTDRWPINCLGYADLRGPRWVREALAKHMEQYQFKHEVDPDKLCIGAGITAVLRLLFVALAERGQACLIPTPHYAGFDWTFKEAEIQRWPVTAPGGSVEVGVDAGISPGLLEQALRSARSNGLEVRLLLLTSPHNPTGRVYSAKALLAAIAWARKRGIHVVVDEVYANCVHRPNASFQSVGKLMMEGPGMGKDIHILYGPGKDMGIPGWRIGALYSENADVLWAVSMMCHGAQCSTLSTEVWGRMLLDQDLCDKHFAQHEESLREAYMAVTQTLGKEGILYMYAEAGIFLMLDLREFLEEHTEEGELNLWRYILTSTNVSFTPGLNLHCPEPGWFRLCFARERSIDKVCRGLERVGACLRALVANKEGPSAQGSGEPGHACQDNQESPGVQGDAKVDQDRQPGAGVGVGAGSPPVGEIPRDNQGDDGMTKGPEGDASGTVTSAGVGPSGGDLGESFVRVEDGGDVAPSAGRKDAGGEVAPAQGGSLDEGHSGHPEVSPGNVVDVKPW